MDRSLTLESLRSLARELIHCSSEFEPFVPGHRLGTQEALALLGGLESVARKSLGRVSPEAPSANAAPQAKPEPQIKTPIQAPPANPAPRATAPSQQAARQASRTRFDTRNAQYKPALRDPTVIEALLKLRNNRAQSAAQTHLGAQRVSAAAHAAHAAHVSSITTGTTGAPETTATPSPQAFSNAEPAQVDTQSVSYVAKPRRTPGTASILRPNPPASTR